MSDFPGVSPVVYLSSLVRVPGHLSTYLANTLLGLIGPLKIREKSWTFVVTRFHREAIDVGGVDDERRVLRCVARDCST